VQTPPFPDNTHTRHLLDVVLVRLQRPNVPVYWVPHIWDLFLMWQCQPCYHTVAGPSTAHRTSVERAKYSHVQKNW
jgi:hypothetical protein